MKEMLESEEHEREVAVLERMRNAREGGDSKQAAKMAFVAPMMQRAKEGSKLAAMATDMKQVAAAVVDNLGGADNQELRQRLVDKLEDDIHSMQDMVKAQAAQDEQPAHKTVKVFENAFKDQQLRQTSHESIEAPEALRGAAWAEEAAPHVNRAEKRATEEKQANDKAEALVESVESGEHEATWKERATIAAQVAKSATLSAHNAAVIAMEAARSISEPKALKLAPNDVVQEQQQGERLYSGESGGRAVADAEEATFTEQPAVTDPMAEFTQAEKAMTSQETSADRKAREATAAKEIGVVQARIQAELAKSRPVFAEKKSRFTMPWRTHKK